MVEILKPYRARIDALDDQILDLLRARIEIIHEVAVLKAEQGLPAILQDRVDEVINRNAARAKDLGLDEAMIREFYIKLVAHCCALEDRLMDEESKKRGVC